MSLSTSVRYGSSGVAHTPVDKCGLSSGDLQFREQAYVTNVRDVGPAAQVVPTLPGTGLVLGTAPGPRDHGSATHGPAVERPSDKQPRRTAVESYRHPVVYCGGTSTARDVARRAPDRHPAGDLPAETAAIAMCSRWAAALTLAGPRRGWRACWSPVVLAPQGTRSFVE